jgi:deoxyribodipyrimidine photolyase
MRTAIVAFTRDLRLHDNPALDLACRRAEQVLPVFVVDLALTAAPNRMGFLADSLTALRGGLRERGGDLVLRRGDPAAEVMRLAGEPARARCSSPMTCPGMPRGGAGTWNASVPATGWSLSAPRE